MYEVNKKDEACAIQFAGSCTGDEPGLEKTRFPAAVGINTMGGLHLIAADCCKMYGQRCEYLVVL